MVGLPGNDYKKALDDAIGSGIIPPTIAVFIDAYEIAFLSSDVFGNWESFLISELIPFVDSEYRTITDPLTRGLMGWSMGGYSATILAMLHPDVWRSVGCNDPSYWVMWRYTGNSTYNARVDLLAMPDDTDGYKSLNDIIAKIMWQVGARVSPNPDASLLYDHPVDSDGKWILEVKEKWIAYDLSNPDTLAEHKDTLNNLLSFTVVTPTGGGGGTDNRNYINNTLKPAGITVTNLDMPGDHYYQRQDRFIALAEQILNAMIGAEVSVSLHGSIVVTWGAIRHGNLIQ